MLEKQKAQGSDPEPFRKKNRTQNTKRICSHTTREKIAESARLSTSVLCSMSKEREIR